MGWTPDEEIIKIDFTGTRFEGLTVRVEDVDIATTTKMMRLVARLKARDSGDDTDGHGSAGAEAVADAFDELIRMAGAMLHDWDMEYPEGNPLPPTADGLARLKRRTAVPLITMILNAMQEVEGDLKKDFPSGREFPAASIPMTAL